MDGIGCDNSNLQLTSEINEAETFSDKQGISSVNVKDDLSLDNSLLNEGRSNQKLGVEWVEKVQNDGLPLKTRPTWKRLARMVCGPDEATREESPALGKRGVQQKEVYVDLVTDEQSKKREKIEGVPQTTKTAGGPNHPCRAQ